MWLECSLCSKNCFFSLLPAIFFELPITRTPDNSNLFRFPLKVRVIGSRLYFGNHNFNDRCTDKFEVYPLFLAMTEVDFWCILASDKTASEMDTNFEQAWPIINAMSVFRRFSTRYFVAKFSYGIGVLGTPQCPPKASLVWWISGINCSYLHSQLFWKIIIIIMCNNNNNNCKQSNVWKLIADFLKRNFIFSCWVRSCLDEWAFLLSSSIFKVGL